ncbi:DGQHR domain-containing protein [Vibrio cholerae]|uniref:DGQHR domain-containing protein n=1 Tax=Vibrio cholerae TaxID=666 RepID=UPI0000EF9125|nr:DGQHR domain-containing protein [Vibrio cholerae]EGR2240179.1 DGQHR domain-containing protein [Vibrio cholerae]EGR4434777.1 DGQHR domain-containing protein [Vibrio cholerae]EGR4450397.1 DGQHR domain-containing protein [Vibrio cholerae]EJL6376520.1 DGQHR domain-containing protein [Vibrio cholerae]EJL6412276.1 DGQHR domain-containing protein [Vibrio cholerae]
MSKRILLPCLRGSIGNWVTYTCLMRLQEIVDLISYAEDIHKSKKLSKMIQRELKKDRQKEIGEYLLNDEEAFFNSLVVAIYNGEPKWHQFDAIKNKSTTGLDEFETFDYANESLGYLSLTKDESIFALDGQHRLSGIEYAINRDPDLAYKQIPVTFIPHFNDEEGLIRTRRLFTTLNKKAKPVNKAAIISLDEDDLAACITRYLVENNDNFSEDKIKFQANNNVSYTDTSVITTIGNLYDLVKIILKDGFGLKPKEIDNYRRGEDFKIDITNKTEELFDYFFSSIPELNEFQTSDERDKVVTRCRQKLDGGHFLFRPLGLRVFMLALCKYSSLRAKDDVSFSQSVEEFINSSYRFSFSLESELLLNRVWDKDNKRIIPLKADDRNHIINSYIGEAKLENDID